MIEHTLDEETSILYVRPKGPLTERDFAALSGMVDPFIERTGDLAGLVIEIGSFPGGRVSAQWRLTFASCGIITSASRGSASSRTPLSEALRSIWQRTSWPPRSDVFRQRKRRLQRNGSWAVCDMAERSPMSRSPQRARLRVGFRSSPIVTVHDDPHIAATSAAVATQALTQLFDRQHRTMAAHHGLRVQRHGAPAMVAGTVQAMPSGVIVD